MELGAYMVALREGRGLSQKEVAERARKRRPDVQGVLQHTISRWERGAAVPSSEQLSAWLDGLDATDEERLRALDRDRRLAA
jgi:transcriptional regulator with XRE-family HTH domain